MCKKNDKVIALKAKLSSVINEETTRESKVWAKK